MDLRALVKLVVIVLLVYSCSIIENRNIEQKSSKKHDDRLIGKWYSHSVDDCISLGYMKDDTIIFSYDSITFVNVDSNSLIRDEYQIEENYDDYSILSMDHNSFSPYSYRIDNDTLKLKYFFIYRTKGAEYFEDLMPCVYIRSN
jgi:hypothetical protein